jgi:hypothetical protein
MNIEVTIANKLTSQLLMFVMAVPDNFGYNELNALHKQFKDFHPDAHVNFEWENDNFMYGMPVNMEKDSENLTVSQYMKKWYSRTQFSENANKKTDNDIIDTFIKELNLN